MDVRDLLDFSPDWERRLWAEVSKTGVLHGKSGLDYFLFPRLNPFSLPPFAVGRPGWDSFLIYHAMSLDVPVIDGTNAIRIVHQNHPPAYKSTGAEAESNRLLAGGRKNMYTLRNTNWILTNEGLSPAPVLHKILGIFLSSSVGKAVLNIKRSLQLQLSRLSS